ncbi:MAG: leucine-rich repeat domain-containing protein [Promethearchaeota archaeon]
MSRDILLDMKNGNISKAEASELLISLIENSEDIDFRIKCLKNLAKIDFNMKETFKVLEDCLISDENLSIRATAADILIKEFLNEARVALDWTIENEESVLVLTSIFKGLKEKNDKLSENLKNEIIKKFSEIYDVVLEEANFILELYSLAIENVEEIRNFANTHRFDGGPFQIPKFYNYFLTPRLEIKEKHIISLDLFFWKLKELPKSIGSLSKLKYLTLGSENLQIIPDSFNSLKELKWVELSSIPEFDTIPNWILYIAKKCYAKGYIKDGVYEGEAAILGLFDILIGHELFRLDKYRDVQNNSHICAYKLNQNGNISEIFLSNPNKFKLYLIPEQILSLDSLEILDLNNNNITKIPNSIGGLNNLKYLDLSNNNIEGLPNSIGSLKSLEYLNIRGNYIKELPNSFKELISLKRLMLDDNLIRMLPQFLKSVIKSAI